MRRLSRGSDESEVWVVIADIVLATLFIFVLFLFAQYMEYDKLAMLEVLEERKQEIAQLVRDSVPDEDSVTVVAGRDFSQRIQFSSDLLFSTCRADLRRSGSSLVSLVGGLLRTRSNYFKSIEVEGHTDHRPPTGKEQCPFEDNWDLSSRRAATVVRILAGDVELDPSRLSSVGRAHYQPPESMSDMTAQEPAGLYRDRDSLRPYRRIELVLEYSEKDIREALEKEGAMSVPEGAGTGG